MEERVFQDYFGLLIPLLTTLLFVVYVKRNRASLIKSVFLGHFSNVHFKSISQSINEKEMTILFWSSIFLQGIYIHTFFINKVTSVLLCYVLVILAVAIKYAAIKVSSGIFQKQQLFQEYYTSFTIAIINIGFISFFFSVINILYFNNMSTSIFETFNYGLLIIILTYWLYKVLFLVFGALKEKISFLHIFFYICTLEILPIVIISHYFLNN